MKAKPKVNKDIHLRTCKTCGENYLSERSRKCFECEQNKTDEFIKKYPWKFVEEIEEECPVKEAIKIELGHLIKIALNYLTPREQKVLRMRYGIELERDYTLVEVAKTEIDWRGHPVSEERIRQIEMKALRKLRRPNLRSLRRVKNFLREYDDLLVRDNSKSSFDEEES